MAISSPPMSPFASPAVRGAACALLLSGCASRSSAPPATTPPEAHRSGSTGRDMGWISVGLGSAAGAIAVGTSVLMLRHAAVRSSECDAQRVCTQDGLDANTGIRSLSGANVAAWIVTGVGLGAGAFLLLTHPANETRKSPNEAPKTEAPTTEVGVAPGGLVLRSSF